MPASIPARLGILFLVAGACGCATKVPRATAAEKSSAEASVTECVRKNVVYLDDGLSPANVIGEAVAANCSKEYTAMAATLSKGIGSNERARLYYSWNPVGNATQAVLSYRAYLANPPPPSAPKKQGL